MKSFLALLVGLSVLALSVRGAEQFKPDPDGFIRNWLILAPIPLASDSNGSEAVDKNQLPDEANVKPKEGDKVKVGDKELVWKKVQTKDYFFDLNEILGTQTENSVAYAVCYVLVETNTTGLKLKMGSDDQAKLYVNGKEILKNKEARALEKDSEAYDPLTLLKGTKTIVFKVINESADWSGCLRFTDKQDKGFPNLKITLSPP